jgi:hypothetical protein
VTAADWALLIVTLSAIIGALVYEGGGDER